MPTGISLTDEQKEKVVFLLGYPAKILVPSSTHYNKIVANRMDEVTQATVERVTELLTLIYKTRTNLDNTQLEAHVTQVDN